MPLTWTAPRQGARIPLEILELRRMRIQSLKDRREPETDVTTGSTGSEDRQEKRVNYVPAVKAKVGFNSTELASSATVG